MSDDAYLKALNILRRHRDTGGADDQSSANQVSGQPLEITITPRPRPQAGQGEGYTPAPEPEKTSGPLDYIANIPSRAREAAYSLTYPLREPAQAWESAKEFAGKITPEDVTRGFGYNAYNLLGTPVDVTAQALKVASHALPQSAYEYVQRNLEKPVMGSEWLKEKAVQAGIAQPPQHTPGELVGEIGGSFIDPSVAGSTAAAALAKVAPAASGGLARSGGMQPMNYGYGGGGYSNQAFFSPGFWNSLLQSLYQPQTRFQGYTAPTYEQMVAQANPGGQAVAPAYTPPAQTPTVQTPAPQPEPAPEPAVYDPSGHTEAAGGRIKPHRDDAAYDHAMKIASGAAPSHGNKPAAAGRRYRTS